MPDFLAPLKNAPRVLIEAELKPVAGTRIQPTGFPDLGPATYDAPNADGGTSATLLVESAQSMANRLEAVCWDEGKDDIAEELVGLPYISVDLKGLPGEGNKTSSLQEFHRLNSPYIINAITTKEMKVAIGSSGSEQIFPIGTPFVGVLRPQLGMEVVAGKPKKESGKAKTESKTAEESTATEKEPDDVAGVVNLRKLAAVCFKYDPNSLVHGVFLEKIAGRLRHPRALSAFIEASGVGRADSGGVKFDRALPKPKVAGVDAKGGYGNVPFHRTEFTAKTITAYFSLDLAQIRGYGLPAEAADLLTVLSLWKVRKFLDSNMRLRSACELELKDGDTSIVAKRPNGFTLPSAGDLAKKLKELIPACKFPALPVTVLTWNNPKG